MSHKIDFLTHFEILFLCPFAPYEIHPKIYTCSKFFQYSICDFEIKNVQNILYWFSIHKMDPFKDFLGPYSPKYCLILLKIWPEVATNKTNTMFEKSFKMLNFDLNGTHPKCTVLVHFEAQFTVVKPKILPKTKISAKTEPLGIINNVSTNSQKNHIILAPMGLCQMLITNSLIAYNRTIHLYFLDVKFQSLIICCF